ncbi:MAG: hypothetical protein AB1295_00245 [Candidatus Micrarchaeota archaeon]
MRLPALLAILMAFFMFSAGCAGRDPERGSFLGMRLQTSDCDNDPKINRDAELMQCYYSVAITQAYMCGVRVSSSSGDLCGPSQGSVPCEAVNVCNEIWEKWSGSGKDIKRKAELMSNHCFYDVAKITRNSNTCQSIQQHEDLGSQLFGDEATAEMCEDEVERLAAATPERYYCSGNQDNICTIVFVLPVLLGLSIARRGP